MDGIDDEEYFLSINEDFDILMPSGSVYPFDMANLWIDEDNPTVEEIAHAVMNQIRIAYMLECSVLYEKIFYFNRLIQKNNIGEHKLSKDTYGRKWTIDYKVISVEDKQIERTDAKFLQ